MSNKVIINKNTYLYDVRPIEHLETECSYLLFNAEKNYWMPVDDMGAELYQVISEMNDMEEVSSFFCEKYDISKDVFLNDTKDFFDLLKRKGILAEQEHRCMDLDSIELSMDLDDIHKYPFNDIYISLSDDCNLNCLYCFNKEKRNVRKKSDNIRRLSVDKIKEIIDDFGKLNGKDVVFTGGEPTLNKHLIELCEYVHQSGMNPHFISNGLLLGRLDLERLMSLVDDFGISLDSIDNNVLNKLWGVDQINLKERIIENLDKIEDICGKLSKTVRIKIMPIVSKMNAEKIGEIVELLKNRYKNIVFRWSMTKYGKIGNEIDAMLDITEDEYVKSVFNALQTLSYDNNKILEYAYSYDNRLKPTHEPQPITCVPSFFVANDGSAYPCQGCEREEMYLGNVWEKTLSDLFDSDVFVDLRKRIIKTSVEKCSKCELLFCCSAVDRPCKCWESDNCKEECIKRMFIDAVAN